MNKKWIAALAIGCLSITGCGENKKDKEPTISSSELIEVYNTTDIINLHGIMSEKGFPLKNILVHTEEGTISGDKMEWQGTSNTAHIKNGYLYYDRVGRAQFSGYYYENEYQLNVSVNQNEETRYLYSMVDVAADEGLFKVREGALNKVSFDKTTNSITLDGMAGGTIRVDYPIDEGFNYDYTIEAGFQFLTATDPSRYAGIMFRTNPNALNPWYQMDVRQDIQLDKPGQAGIECTEKNTEGAYLYPQRSNYHEQLPQDKDAQFKVEVSGMNAKFFIDNNLVIDTTLNNLTSGNIGFQVNNGRVRFSNIKISMGKENVVHTKDGSDSYCGKTNYTELFPVLSPNYSSAKDLIDVVNNRKILSYSLKVGMEQDRLIATTFNGEKIVDLQNLLHNYKTKLIPNIILEDKDIAKKVAHLTAGIGCNDITVLSKDTEILKAYRQINKMNRLGYISSATEIKNYSDASKECFKAGEVGAEIICFDANMITKDIVFWITSRGYGAWAINTDATDDLASYKATLSGASVYISASQENALKAMDTNVFDFNSSLFRKPVITAHRGDGSNLYLPENSLESFYWSKESGANAIELDIHTTKDDQLVVIHGAGSDGKSTVGTTNCDIRMADSTVEQLKSCNLIMQDGTVTNYKIPTFDEVLNAFKDDEMIFVVEIKDSRIRTAQLMLETAKKYNMMVRIVVIDFSTTSLNYIKRVEPGLHVGYLSGGVKNVEDYAKADYQLFNKGLGISPNMGNLAADGIHLSNARGNLYWTWTFNAWNASTFMNFMANGNVGFTTNRADLTTNWKIRFDSEKENYQLSTGSSLTLKAHSTTYAKEVNDETNFTIKVIDGEDIINVNNQSITAKKAGKAHIVLCFRTNLYMESSAKSYYIYSNVIEIDVK